MADKKVSALSAVPSLDGTELVYLVKSGTDYKGTLADLIKFFNASEPRELTSSGTLTLADVITGVRTNSGSALNLTVPANASVAIPLWTSIPVMSLGVGLTTIVADSGVTINVAADLTLVLRSQWSQAVLTKIGTNTWILTGDLEAA